LDLLPEDLIHVADRVILRTNFRVVVAVQCQVRLQFVPRSGRIFPEVPFVKG
jgi:hypothetical protein